MRHTMLIVGLLLLGGCESLPPPPQAGPSSPTPGLEEPVDETTPTPTDCHDLSAAEAGEELVALLDDEFEPACFAISSTQGLQLANSGSRTHNFSIEGALDVDVEPGGRTNTPALETVVEPGTYDFFCKYHRDAGMIGVIIVE
jgi:plastocyanin